MEKNYRFVQRTRTVRCRICGAEVETVSARRRYCDSPECVAKRLQIKSERRKRRRHLLASLGFPIHAKGNK